MLVFALLLWFLSCQPSIDRAFAVAVTLERWCWYLNDLHLKGPKPNPLRWLRGGEASRGTATCDLFSMSHLEQESNVHG